MTNIQAKRNFKLILEYDGSRYHGWQRQRGVLTIQEVLETRLEIMLAQPIGVRGSGRTDAGVHAKGQVANFYARTRLNAEEIWRGLNSLLPRDIVVLHCKEVEHSFHARFSATSKTYEYRILNRTLPSALERDFVWHVRNPLNLAPIHECLQVVKGSHDFAAFMGAGSSVNSTVRCLFRAEVRNSDSHHVHFSFEADGFLRHMVRNLVGTLVDVGKDKHTVTDFMGILEGRDRKGAGMTAPACGLYLMEVRYNETQKA